MRELAPLRVLATAANLGSKRLEAGERRDLDLELGKRRSGSCLIEDLLLGGLDLVLGRLLEILDVFRGEGRSRRGDRSTALQ